MMDTRSEAWAAPKVGGFMDSKEMNMSQKRMHVMLNIDRMSRTGLVNAAREYRKSVLQIHKMNIVEYAGFENTPSMERWLREGMIPMASAVEANFSKYGLCPYKIMPKPFYAGDDQVYISKSGQYAQQYRHLHVAVPMELGSYTLEPYMDEHGVKHICVLDKNGDEIDTVVFSQYRTGPVLFGPGFDSEGGAIVDEFLRMERRLKLADKLLEREADPVVWLRKEVAKATQQNDVENQRYDELVERSRDEHGYPQEKEFQLSTKDGVVMLPPNINTATYQPKSNATVDEAQITLLFGHLVGNTYRVPTRKFAHEGKSFMSHRSESAVDEDRGDMCASLNELSSDLQHAMEKITVRLFKIPIPWVFSLRVQADRMMMEWIHEKGMIDDNVLREEVFNLVGLSKSRGVNPKEIGDMVRDEQSRVFGGMKMSRRLKKLLMIADDDKFGDEEADEKPKKKKKKRVVSSSSSSSEADESSQEEDESSEEETKKKKKRTRRNADASGAEEGKKKKKRGGATQH